VPNDRSVAASVLAGLAGGEVVHMDQLHSGAYLEKGPDLRRYKLARNRLRALRSTRSARAN